MIKYGIIGCGMMGREHLRNIALLDGARVAAIHEPDTGMAAKARDIAPDAVFCASIGDLLAFEELDCLLIASPNHLHVDQFEHVARGRPLPLMIEKPLYTRAEDARRIDLLAAEYPAPVWVAMEYRYMPPVQVFLDELQSATAGPTMLTIREHRFPFLKKVGDWNRFNRYSGGTFVEKCCHFFDLMRLILRAEPVRITASAGQDVNHKDEIYGGDRPDVWDAGFVLVDFDSGARAMLELCMYAEGSRFQEEMTAVGPAGKIEVRVPGPSEFWPHDLGLPPVSEVVVSPREPKGPRKLEVPVDSRLLAAGSHNGSTYYQHARFLDVVRGRAAPEVTLRDGARAVEMGLAAQEAATTGETVRLAPPMPQPHARMSRNDARGRA